MDEPKRFPCTLPHLTEVKVFEGLHVTVDHLEYMLTQLGSQLLKLNLVLDYKSEQTAEKITDLQLPRLEELTIKHFGYFDVRTIGPIRMLRKLTIHSALLLESKFAPIVMERMPALMYLRIRVTKASVKFKRELVKYLQEQRRELWLNGILLNKQG